MDLLLDTHAFLWWDDGKLPRAVVRRIQRADDVYVSAVSAWEISIKAALGKMRVREGTTVAGAVARYQFTELPVAFRHADGVRTLPLHHGDPFDRLLIAWAMSEGPTIVTADRKLEPYRVLVQWI